MSQYTAEQVESEANHLYLLVGMSPSYLMLRAYAATLKAAQGGVTEAMVERARLAIMASDGFEPGSDGYINDSAIRAALEAALSAEPAAPHFPDANALADWLESLHECHADGAVGNRKWEAAQIAAKAVRGAAQTAAQGEEWSRRMAAAEAGQYVGAGAHGIEDRPAPPAQPAERAPEGWKLVPIDATPAMQAAGGHANSEWLNDNAPIGESRYGGPVMRSVWEAMLTASPAPSEGGREVDGWIDAATLPSVKDGHEAHFWIAVRRAHGDKVYVFPAIYANALPLSCGDYDPEDLDGPFWQQRVLPEDSDGDMVITGWYDVRSNSEYDSYYTPVCSKGDVILAWHAGPEFPTTGAAR